MTNELAVSMDELELESAELLPSRETLHMSGGWSGGGGHNFTFVQAAQGGNSSGFINVPILSGNAVNVALF
jgi:hypothetical protein